MYLTLATAKEFGWVERRQGLFGQVQVRRAPVGVVGAIVPWNVPQVLIMPKMIPALIAGCTVVVKPAPETPLDAMWLAEMLEDLDLPEGVVSVVPGGRETGETLVRHPDVDKIAFTGSSATGKHIAAACGEQLKRVSLELGGKSAAIILDDADVDHTVKHLKMAGLMNNGQACVAQTRILVSERRHDEVVDALAEMVSGLNRRPCRRVDRHRSPCRQASAGARAGYIRSGIDEGAKVVVGGTDKPHDRGWYVRPTLFTDATNDMKIAREEIFGPVLTVLKYYRRSRRGPHRQRQRLRARRFGVDRRRLPRFADRRRDSHRHLRNQHVPARHQRTVRRIQAVRHRTRVRPRGAVRSTSSCSRR